MSWWFLIEILGLAALPIAYRGLRWLPDRGLAISKALGLLISSYLLWFGAITGFLSNNAVGILVAILAILFTSAYLLRKRDQLDGFLDFVRQNKRLILIIELLFAAAFIGWAVLRAFAPDKVMNTGGEKFMEMAFLNGVLNSANFPPLDPWLAGFSISYYYFGYVMMGLMTRFTGVTAGVGFELYDALLFALTAVGAFGVVYNLVASSRGAVGKILCEKNGSQSAIHQPAMYGLLGALFVVIMGNLEGLLESLYSRGILPESFWRWIDIPGLVGSPVTGSWVPAGGFFGCCWRASRILQDYDLYKQPIAVSPITEFPLFSFLLGDNHPHVLALPFVLLLIGMAFNLLLRQISKEGSSSVTWWNPARALLDGDWALLLFYALCLGALGFLNTWDMPIYLVLLALAYGIGEYYRVEKGVRIGQVIIRSVYLAITLLLAAILFYLFFYVGFSSQAGGILPYVFKPTRLAQYLVMFGGFIYIIIWFLVVATIRKASLEGKNKTWKNFLIIWGWIILFSILLLGFFLLAIGLAALTGRLDNPVVSGLLGGTTVFQAIGQFLLARIANPWLFVLVTGMLALAVNNLRKDDRPQVSQDSVSETGSALPANDSDGSLDFSGVHKVDPGSLFAFLLIFLGLGLTLSVEFLYLRDSFGVRMNTVFKFYFQAWLLLGCGSAFGVWWLLNPGKMVLKSLGRIIFLFGALMIILAGIIYPLIASYARVDGMRGVPNLDGTSSLAQANPDDWAAIEWLIQNGALTNTSTRAGTNWGKPIILEAPGRSYNYEGRISAFSGFPTLLGWAIHEGQWRGNYDEQGKREPDIQTIYTTKSGGLALELLQKWNVRYVIVGPSEISYIQQLCSDPNRACNLSRALRKFETTLEPIFKQGNVAIYRVPEANNQ